MDSIHECKSKKLNWRRGLHHRFVIQLKRSMEKSAQPLNNISSGFCPEPAKVTNMSTPTASYNLMLSFTLLQDGTSWAYSHMNEF